MADKLTARVQRIEGGEQIDKWMREHVYSAPSINEGELISCFDVIGEEEKQPWNRVGIYFEDCKWMRKGTESNIGYGGSHCTTGNPTCFVDISALPETYPRKTLDEKNGTTFVLPLALLGEPFGMGSDLDILMKDAYVNFIAM